MRSISSSTVEAPTFIVPDDVNRGGAQRRGRTDTKTVYLSSDLDYVRGRHSLRSGIEMQHWRFDSDAETNYLGTYYFDSPESFDAGRPLASRGVSAIRTSATRTRSSASTSRTTCS